jgi:tRNA (guanine37-N1)-methyltransferase
MPSKTPKIRFSLISAAPETAKQYAAASILGRAQRAGHIAVSVVPLRDFADPPHYAVDDKPFGGGPGMVLKVEPIVRAVKAVAPRKSASTRTILFSTRGSVFDQKAAERLSRYKHLVLICGRYEGVDERIAQYVADEELSLGDFVLTGGELPALCVIDAVSRLIPGVLGKQESLEHINGSFPTYTRPASFVPGKGKPSWDVPEVLASGNHADIATWRRSAGSK